MPFDGWLAYAGTEVINSERTSRYMRSLTPGLSRGEGLPDDDDTELSTWLGDQSYDAPIQDDPPWFSAFRPESMDFAGLIPLSLEGFDDGLAETAITELVYEGASVGRLRRPSRSLRVTGLLVASTEKGLDYGHSWLRTVLSAGSCDGCSGESLCFLSAAPISCQDDLVRTILDVDYTTWTAGRVDPEWDPEGTISASHNWLEMGTARPGDTFSHMIEGLVPGATYHVDLGLDTYTSPQQLDSRFTLAIAGSSDEVEVNGRWAGTGNYDGVGFLEFVATDTRHRLVLTVLEVPVDLRFTHLRVVRAPYPTVMGISTLGGDAGEKFAWTADIEGGVTATILEGDRAGYEFSGTSGAPLTLGMRRLVRNLVNGEDYTLRVGVWGINSDGTPQRMAVRVGSTVVYTEEVPDDHPQVTWITVPFTATDVYTTVEVLNANTWVLVDNPTEAYVAYMRLERNWGPNDVKPVTDQSILRTYRNVALTGGPTTIREFASRSGYMRQVEWTMQAGSPRPQGEPIQVPAPMLGPLRHHETVCQNGEEVLHNLLTNPSFEVSPYTTNWTLTGANYTVASYVNAALATTGSRLARIAYGGTTPVTGTWTAAPVAVTPLTRYTFSIDVTAQPLAGETLPGTIIATARVTEYVHWIDRPTFEIRPNGRQRVWGSFVTAPTASSVQVGLSFTINRGPTGQKPYLLVDGAMLSTTSRDLYVDGSVPGGSWDGAAGASTSTWGSPIAPTIYDPDCPPPPAPPRPPAVINGCISTPPTWLRHTVTIPADVTQVGSSAFPVVSLITGASAVRNVRLRLYSNRFGIDPVDINCCDFCGEWLLSYMPANATVTIDASVREATLLWQGGEQSAMGLLYGSDGNPVEWPEMQCGVGYMLAVDLDASLDPLIGLDAKVITIY
jgi:hypothetical protein